MALSIQTAYCVIQNQAFDDKQLTKDAFNILQANEDSNTNNVGADDLCELIRTHAFELKQRGISGCVCVLLPKISNRSTLKNITHELFATLGKRTSLDTYLYPYGESSFLMALARIQREIQSARPTWILALNVSKADDANSHDSIILAVCTEQSSGLTSGTVRIDLDAVTQSIAVEKVIGQLGASSRKQISDLALTIEGEDPLWLHSMSGLSPWVTVSSQYTFSNIKFGSLGACNGLLKTINLYHQQRLQPKSAFQALQLDIEPNGYVAGTLYGWSND